MHSDRVPGRGRVMRANRVILVSLIVASGGPGCTRPAADVRHHPERARSALVATLDARKRGEARELARRAPPSGSWTKTSRPAWGRE
jgi:hypothetical protein